MSYTPINWQTGDTITAEKLNKMDNGWSIETSGSELFSETVTTEKEPNYPDAPAGWNDFEYAKIVADSITVTFNGNEYECTLMTDGYDSNFYGGWVEDGGEYASDFSVYPFGILSETGFFGIYTEVGGTYTVKIEAHVSTVETSSDFQKAVDSVVDTSMMPMLCKSGETTISEMYSASAQGRLLYFKPYGNANAITNIITMFDSNQVVFIPENNDISVTFTNDIFTVSVT